MKASGSCRLLVGSSTSRSAGLTGRSELGVARRPDSGGTAGEDVGGCHVADRAVQADRVVVLDPAGNEGAGVVEGLGLAGSDRVALDGLVPALDLAVRLRVVRRG